MKRPRQKPPFDPPLRSEAEARLATAGGFMDAGRGPGGTRQPVGELVHELQVHQIELEMQNETLRQAQIALEESRDRYIDFYDFSPVGYLTLTDKGLITEINLTGAAMLGMERTRLLQRRFSHFVAAEDGDRWHQHFNRALGEDASLRCELVLSRRDGSRMEIRLDSLRRQTDEKTPMLRVVLIDIAERRRVQRDLSASREFTRSLIDCMQDGVAMVDTDGVLLDVNPALCSMTGFSREELIGTATPRAYWPPEEHEIILEAFRKFQQGQQFANLDLTFMRKGGERFPVILSPSTVADGAGRIVSYAAIVMDITQRKRSEEALKASQRRFRDIVNATDGIVWEADACTSDFTFVSEKAERLLGYPVADWLQPGFWAKHMHPDERLWVPEYCAEHTQHLEPYDFEYRFIAQDGRTVWLHDIVTVGEEDGAPRWLRGIMVDITRRRLAEEQLREMAGSLEAKVVERTAQLRKLSAQLTMTEERERHQLAQDLHDNLGQLLAVIKIKLSSVDARSRKSSIVQITDLVDQAEKSARMLTQQLSPPILHTLGFRAGLEWLAEEIQRVYGLTVHVGCDCHEKRMIDEMQSMLYRSVRELLINVAKHAGARDANLSCLGQGDKLVLVVSDAGRGFDPADHFGASPGSHSFGLRSIHERVTNLGGRMEIDSSPGDGTTVTLTVPFSTIDEEIRDDPHNACR